MLEREAEIEAHREQAEYEERKRKAREAEESVRRVAQRARLFFYKFICRKIIVKISSCEELLKCP